MCVYLAALLMKFGDLDVNGDSALDYEEFSSYAGTTDSTHYIFNAMDFNQDEYITRQEIMSAVQMLQRPTTEGTEAIPDEDLSENHVESVTDSQTSPEAATNPPADSPTPYVDSTSSEPSGVGTTTTEPFSATNATSTPDGSSSAPNVEMDDVQKTQQALEILSGI